MSGIRSLRAQATIASKNYMAIIVGDWNTTDAAAPTSAHVIFIPFSAKEFERAAAF